MERIKQKTETKESYIHLEIKSRKYSEKCMLKFSREYRKINFKGIKLQLRSLPTMVHYLDFRTLFIILYSRKGNVSETLYPIVLRQEGWEIQEY